MTTGSPNVRPRVGPQTPGRPSGSRDGKPRLSRRIALVPVLACVAWHTAGAATREFDLAALSDELFNVPLRLHRGGRAMQKLIPTSRGAARVEMAEAVGDAPQSDVSAARSRPSTYRCSTLAIRVW